MKKFKKMASGGDTLSDADLRSLKGAGLNYDFSNRAAEMEAYRKRQDAAERASKARKSAASKPAPGTGGGRGGDRVMPRSTTGGRQSAKMTYSDYQMKTPPKGGDDGLGAISPYNRARYLAERESPIGYKGGKLMTDRQMLDSAREMNAELPEVEERVYGRKSELGMKKGGNVKKMASGGRARSYKDMDAGSGGGMGRIEKTAIAKAGKKIAMKYKKGGEIATDSDYTSNPMFDSGYKELGEKSKKKMAKGGKVKKMGDGSVAKVDYGRSSRDYPTSKFDSDEQRAKLNEKKDLYSDISAKKERVGRMKLSNFADTARRAVDALSRNPYAGYTTGRADKTGMKKGGKVEKFEGSAKDMAEDKRLAKKYGMSMKKWEASSMDAKHDAQKSAKGLKKGGKAHAKSCDCMACGGKAKYAMGGMSTAQDGKKAPLRPRPSAMAKGGKVTFGDKPLPGTKTKANPGMVLTGASTKKTGLKAPLRGKASGAKPTGMMKPLGMTKMASGGKVRGTGIAQRGTKFIGEV